MNLSWLQSIMMGFVSGFSEPMPMSAKAHRGLLRLFYGAGPVEPLFLLMCHIAVLVVVLMSGHLELNRLRRTSKLLNTPPRRRTSSPELNSAGTLKLLRSAALVVVLGRLISFHLDPIADKLYLLFPMLIVGGVILWMPTQMRTGNKDGRHLTGADGLVMGIGAALSALPGISLVGAAVSLGAVRCADRRYTLRFAWILLALDQFTAAITDLLKIARTGFTFALSELFSAVLGGIFAAVGAYLAVQFMLILVRRGGKGISGFCYYNWGLALLCLILFLLV